MSGNSGETQRDPLEIATKLLGIFGAALSMWMMLDFTSQGALNRWAADTIKFPAVAWWKRAHFNREAWAAWQASEDSPKMLRVAEMIVKDADERH